eukprot:13766801-Alexandrium_andersonii.AAC.1
MLLVTGQRIWSMTRRQVWTCTSISLRKQRSSNGTPSDSPGSCQENAAAAAAAPTAGGAPGGG